MDCPGSSNQVPTRTGISPSRFRTKSPASRTGLSESDRWQPPTRTPYLQSRKLEIASNLKQATAQFDSDAMYSPPGYKPNLPAKQRYPSLSFNERTFEKQSSKEGNRAEESVNSARVCSPSSRQNRAFEQSHRIPPEISPNSMAPTCEQKFRMPPASIPHKVRSRVCDQREHSEKTNQRLLCEQDLRKSEKFSQREESPPCSQKYKMPPNNFRQRAPVCDESEHSEITHQRSLCEQNVRKSEKFSQRAELSPCSQKYKKTPNNFSQRAPVCDQREHSEINNERPICEQIRRKPEKGTQRVESPPCSQKYKMPPKNFSQRAPVCEQTELSELTNHRPVCEQNLITPEKYAQRGESPPCSQKYKMPPKNFSQRAPVCEQGFRDHESYQRTVPVCEPSFSMTEEFHRGESYRKPSKNTSQRSPCRKPAESEQRRAPCDQAYESDPTEEYSQGESAPCNQNYIVPPNKCNQRAPICDQGFNDSIESSQRGNEFSQRGRSCGQTSRMPHKNPVCEQGFKMPEKYNQRGELPPCNQGYRTQRDVCNQEYGNSDECTQRREPPPCASQCDHQNYSQHRTEFSNGPDQACMQPRSPYGQPPPPTCPNDEFPALKGLEAYRQTGKAKEQIKRKLEDAHKGDCHCQFNPEAENDPLINLLLNKETKQTFGTARVTLKDYDKLMGKVFVDLYPGAYSEGLKYKLSSAMMKEIKDITEIERSMMRTLEDVDSSDDLVSERRELIEKDVYKIIRLNTEQRFMANYNAAEIAARKGTQGNLEQVESAVLKKMKESGKGVQIDLSEVKDLEDLTEHYVAEVIAYMGVTKPPDLDPCMGQGDQETDTNCRKVSSENTLRCST